MRSAGGANSAPPSFVTRATKSRIADLTGPLFQDGSGWGLTMQNSDQWALAGSKWLRVSDNVNRINAQERGTHARTSGSYLRNRARIGIGDGAGSWRGRA